MSDDRRKRSGCTAPLLTLLAIAFFIAAGMYVWRTSVYRNLEASIRAKGEPLTFRELDAWYAPVPDDRNAALLVIAAADRLYEPPRDAPVPIMTDYKWDYHAARLPEETRDAVAEVLVANEESLKLLNEAAPLTESRYPGSAIDAFAGTLDHLTPIRNIARLQCLNAIHATNSGDMDRATRSAIQIVWLGDTLRNEPLLISQLVRMACLAIGVNAVDYVLNNGTVAEENLKALQDRVLSSDNPDAMHRAMSGERCVTTDANFANPGGAEGPFFRVSRGSAAKTYTRLVDASTLPSAERRRQFQQIQQEADRSAGGIQFYLNPLAAIILPGVASSIDGFDRTTAQLRIAVTAIAIERCRLASGKLPGSLDALVPAYLDAVPADPFDGNPLRYLQGDSGYTVYSIGVNLKDDQGAEPDNKFKSGDIILKVSR